MCEGITTAFWGMTLNNPDENELILVQQGFPDYMRELVYTHEVGAEGTPHIQAWIKLQRQHRLSFCRKLFPRAKFFPLTSDEYKENTKRYAQKLDDTAVSAAVHKFNDPLKTIEPVIRSVILKIQEILDAKYGKDNWIYDEKENKHRLEAERKLVEEDFRYAKVFVSSVYEKMWKFYGTEMCKNILTHTHTHTQG